MIFHADPYEDPKAIGLISAYILKLCLCKTHLEGGQ